MYGAVLIIVLIVLGGIIAYAGDWIGRRVGRQRLTLFGLRPKYTSVVVAVITGVMVVGTTLATLIIVDNDFREMLVDYGSVKTELVATQGSLSNTRQRLSEVESDLEAKLDELGEKESEIGKLTEQIGPLQKQIEDLNRQIEEKTQTNRELQQANEELGKRVDELDRIVEAKEKALQAAEEKLQTANGRLIEVQEDFEKTSNELAKTQSDLNETKEDLNKARADRDKAESELAGAKEQLEEAQGDLEKARTELAQVRTELDSTRSELDSKMSELELAQGTITDLQAEISDLGAEIDDLATERGELEAERNGLLDERDALLKERDALSEDKASLTEEVSDLQLEVGSLEAEISDLDAERQALTEEIGQLTEKYNELRGSFEAAKKAFGGQYELFHQLLEGATQGTIVEVKGTLIDNWVIAPGDVETLDYHLAELRQRVRQRWNKDFQVVQANLNAARMAISIATDRTLVRAVLAENVYQDDQLTSVVLANVMVDERRLVFEKGTVIALSESPVDPRGMDRYQIMEALYTVGVEAKEKAFESGVYVFTDGTVGVDVSDSVDDVVTQIMELSEPVRLYMKADRDVYNTDGPIDWSFDFWLERTWKEQIEPKSSSS